MALHCNLTYYISFKLNDTWHYKPVHKELSKSPSKFYLEEYTKFYITTNNNIKLNVINSKSLPTEYINGKNCYYMDNDGYCLIKLSKFQQSTIIRLPIKPIPITENERATMINDLETFSIGETRESFQDAVSTYGYTNKKFTCINENMFKQLANNSLKIINTFKLISYNPSINLKNEYLLKIYPKKIDFKAIKKNNKKNTPIKNFSRIKEVSYKNQENSWMKYIALQLINYSKNGIYYFIKKIDILKNHHNNQKIYYNYINESEKEYKNNIYDLSKKGYHKLISNLKILISYLVYFTNETFFKDIISIPSYISKKLILSPEYNYIYKIYQCISQDEITLNKRNYNYLEKPTQNLYEIWVTITTLKALMQLGFSLNSDINSIKYYGLQQGDSFYLNKDSLYLVLIYNKSITNNSLLKEKSEYTNNKPDIRIDIFKRKNYIGSIILDAKFKYAENISPNSTQFKSYKRGFISPVLHLNKYLQHLGNLKNKSNYINPIYDVFAIFPNYRHKEIYNKLYSNYFTYKKLAPNDNLNAFKLALNTSITKCLVIYKKYLFN